MRKKYSFCTPVFMKISFEQPEVLCVCAAVVMVKRKKGFLSTHV